MNETLTNHKEPVVWQNLRPAAQADLLLVQIEEIQNMANALRRFPATRR